MQRQPNIVRVAFVSWKPIGNKVTKIECVPILNPESEKEWLTRIAQLRINNDGKTLILSFHNKMYNYYANVDGTWIVWYEE